MSTPRVNLPNFRQAFNLTGKIHPDAVKAIEFCFNGFVNHEQAFAHLTPTSTATSKSTTSTTSTTNPTTNSVTPQQAANIAVQTIQSTLGLTNNQTGTTYTAVNSDYASIVTLDNASPVAVTLTNNGTGIGPQWWTFFQNNGAGTATLTPASGTLNGAGSISLVTGQSAAVFFDGTNWWAATSTTGGGGTITAVVAGTGLSGGGASGSVTLDIAATAVTPGSYTSADITVNAEGQITAAANGSGGYSLGGSVSATNVAFGPAAGSGASVVMCDGLDGTHEVEFTTGSAPTSAGIIFTFTFTNNRGHNTFPVLSFAQSFVATTFPYVGGGSPTQYTVNANGIALSPLTTYWLYVSAP